MASVKKLTGMPGPNGVRDAEPPSRFPWRKGRLRPLAARGGEDPGRQASADREGGRGVHWHQAPSEVSLERPLGSFESYHVTLCPGPGDTRLALANPGDGQWGRRALSGERLGEPRARQCDSRRGWW